MRLHQHSGLRWRGPVLAVWAGLWSVVVGLLFVGVTVLTITLWIADPQYAQTTPVGDLSFFSLGMVIGAGFVSQTVRRAPLVGVVQSLLAALALAVTGLVGRRIEPFTGGLVLVAVGGVLWSLHSRPRRMLRCGSAVSWALAVLALVAWAGGVMQARRMLDAARDAGPSCFLGQCAHGDRLAEMAATAVTVAAVATLSSLRTDGWRLPLWSAGTAAMTVGGVSLALPVAEGSLGGAGGTIAIAWGGLFVIVGEREWRSSRRRELR